MKVLAVLGTRPEAIKLAPVIQQLERRAVNADVQPVVCATAQHRHMLDQVLELFAVSPDYDLDLMTENQTPTRVAALALSLIEPVLRKERPDWVIVQGDTTTVAAVSLAAYYAGLKVAHVEAGLRTHDRHQPFPEEINRRIAAVTADLHFAPTLRARENLVREGITEDRILVSGNPVIDALLQVVERPTPPNVESLLRSIGVDDQGNGRMLVLVTAHRRENLGLPLENVCNAIVELARRYEGQLQFIYPVHLNPGVREPVFRILGDEPNITLLPPLDFVSLAHVMRHAHLVLTDSGGIQEEAPALGKPVLVLRETTERPEGVEAGIAKVIGTDPDRIVSEAACLIEHPSKHRRMARTVHLYGDGHAARRIVASLLDESVEPFAPADLQKAALPHD